ncbi:MAG: ATP-binding protein [Pseudoclavibacter sp.]|nr:ATP-binding protein [Pseudoclavibacter sp.]
MRAPAHCIVRHLMWTRSGVVWASWRLRGTPYGYASSSARRAARLRHQALLRSLRGEALLLGLCAQQDPVSIAERMLAGVRVSEHRDWAEEVLLTLDALAEVPVGERAFWLSVPLAGTDLRQRARCALRAAGTRLRVSLALPRRLPDPDEIDEALAAASRVEEAIPAEFQARPAGAAELVWMAVHAQQRGLRIDAETPLPPERAPRDGRTVPAGRPTMPCELPDAVLDEGGRSDRPAGPAGWNPFSRRYLKIASPGAEAASYQVLLALTGTPKGGWAVPGVEWLARVDDFEFPVDWAVRLQIASGSTVRRRNKSAENTLRDQILQQHPDEGPGIVDGAGHLSEVAESLRSYADSLARSEREVEVQATTILAVAGADAAEANLLATTVRQRYALGEFVFDPPLGGQEALWWAMQPGVPSERIVRELAQITTGREFASAVPLASTELGDRRGIRLAENITSGRRAPVFLDPEGTIQADRSASIGIVAELGAGKSYALKKIAGDVLDRGGRVFIIDRTEAREYARFADSLLPGRTTTVDLVRPRVSLDPLRIFGAREGSRHVQSLFAAMLGIRPRQELGVELSRLLSAERLQAEGIEGLAGLRASLRGDGAAGRLRGLMDTIAEKDLGRVLFDPELPALELGRRAIIPLTAGLALPSEAELASRHLFEELPLEKIFGRAVYAFLTGLARQICFTTEEFALFCADECHHITISPEGRAHVLDFLRDGRKHNAAAVLASHDPQDFGDVRARGLIPVRIVMRHTDAELAGRALEWLDRELADDAGLRQELMEDTSPAGPDGAVPPERRGEAILRDAMQRIGRIRITPPQRPARRLALSSTPAGAGGPGAGAGAEA